MRTANWLMNAGINYLGELIQKTEEELLRSRNFGRKSLREIKDILEQMGLSLGIRLDDKLYQALQEAQ